VSLVEGDVGKGEMERVQRRLTIGKMEMLCWVGVRGGRPVRILVLLVLWMGLLMLRRVAKVWMVRFPPTSYLDPRRPCFPSESGRSSCCPPLEELQRTNCPRVFWKL
jgi:hypothetical protein